MVFSVGAKQVTISVGVIHHLDSSCVMLHVSACLASPMSVILVHLLFIKLGSLFGQLCISLPRTVSWSTITDATLMALSHSPQINFVSIESQSVNVNGNVSSMTCMLVRLQKLSCIFSICLSVCLSPSLFFIICQSFSLYFFAPNTLCPKSSPFYGFFSNNLQSLQTFFFKLDIHWLIHVLHAFT